MSQYRSEPCPRCIENGRDSRGDNLVIWPDGSGHCFACGYHRSVGILNALAKIHNVKDDHGTKSLLPVDFSREIPTGALQWLLKWGLPHSYWRESIGYSAKESRLIFRVGAPLAFSIGRYFGEEKHRKWYVWGDCHRHAEIVGTGNSIVLVEDWISANKVGQLTECIPLFGTVVHKPVLYHLINCDKPVKLWLDKDQEGLVKQKAVNLSSLINRPVEIIITDKDAKEYTMNKLKEII